MAWEKLYAVRTRQQANTVIIPTVSPRQGEQLRGSNQGNLAPMLITVEISEQFAARAADRGLTPQAYAEELLSKAEADGSFDADWIAEAERRADQIDSGNASLVSWEEIEQRLRKRIAS
jgi:hypothetical protein